MRVAKLKPCMQFAWPIWLAKRPHHLKIERYDQVALGGKGKYFRDPKTKLWWSKDVDGHGGSAWKVFKEAATGLEWVADADRCGQYMPEKHKSSNGKEIDWSDLKRLSVKR